MKKIIALLLALMMILSFTAIVSADGTLHSSDEVDAALKLDSYEITSTKKAGPYGSDTNLFDKNISTASTGSGATKWQVNWAFCEAGDSITFNISSENAIAFSGVRFYSLRVDNPTDGSYGAARRTEAGEDLCQRFGRRSKLCEDRSFAGDTQR